jgi:hypothetical protein
MHSAVRSKLQKSAEGFSSRAGYKSGGTVDPDAAQDKGMISKGVHQHESAMHKGAGKTKLALKSGGRVEGFASGGRLDKPSRRGGSVNVIVNAGGDKEAAAKEGLQKGIKIGAVMGAQAIAAKLGGGAGGPPAGPAAQAGAPMPVPSGDGAPMPPPGMGGPMKRGGRVAAMTGGAEGGLGRIQKANAYGGGHIKIREHMRRKSGGAV